jgi:putative SOS response-associated peptidase YedK
MCGRYSMSSAPHSVRRRFNYVDQPNFPPRYNIAPTQPIAIVRMSEGQRRFALVRWGLIPSWVKDPKAFSLLINARAESVNEKPAFRNAMRHRRCLIPADGFYEWKRDAAGGAQPYFITLREDGPFAFAGLWETWTGPNGEEMETAAIVTTQASPLIAPIHDRMPVILPPSAYDLWLDCRNVDAKTAAALLVPAPDAMLRVYPVSKAVNRTANDSPDLITEVTPDMAARPSPSQKRSRAPKKQPSLF